MSVELLCSIWLAGAVVVCVMAHYVFDIAANHALATGGISGAIIPLIAAIEAFGRDPVQTLSYGLLALASLVAGLAGLYSAITQTSEGVRSKMS